MQASLYTDLDIGKAAALALAFIRRQISCELCFPHRFVESFLLAMLTRNAEFELRV